MLTLLLGVIFLGLILGIAAVPIHFLLSVFSEDAVTLRRAIRVLAESTARDAGYDLEKIRLAIKASRDAGRERRRTILTESLAGVDVGTISDFIALLPLHSDLRFDWQQSAPKDPWKDDAAIKQALDALSSYRFGG